MFCVKTILFSRTVQTLAAHISKHNIRVLNQPLYSVKTVNIIWKSTHSFLFLKILDEWIGVFNQRSQYKCLCLGTNSFRNEKDWAIYQKGLLWDIGSLWAASSTERVLSVGTCGGIIQIMYLILYVRTN